MYKRSHITGRTLEDVIRAVNSEFQKIEQLLIELETEVTQYQVKHAEPTKPKEGMMATADGTDWNPGSGAGPYFYNGNEWLPLITKPTAERPRFARLRITSFAPKFTNTSQIFRIPKATLRLTRY